MDKYVHKKSPTGNRTFKKMRFKIFNGQKTKTLIIKQKYE